MFVLLIVMGSKGFSDFVNDILSSLHFDSFNWKPSARDCNKFINARLHRADSILFHTLSEGSIIHILPDARIRHPQVKDQEDGEIAWHYYQISYFAKLIDKSLNRQHSPQ